MEAYAAVRLKMADLTKLVEDARESVKPHEDVGLWINSDGTVALETDGGVLSEASGDLLDYGNDAFCALLEWKALTARKQLEMQEESLLKPVPPPNVVFESMTRFETEDSYVIRVWREEPVYTFGPDPEVLEVIASVVNKHVTLANMANEICKLPRISAVEILNRCGQGGLKYPDWK